MQKLPDAKNTLGSDKTWTKPQNHKHSALSYKTPKKALVLWWKLVQYVCFEGLSSNQFSCTVVSESLRHHGLQHTRLPCPGPTPRACSNSCPSSQWCHPTISFLVAPFSSCLQIFPASGSCPMSQFFISGGQSIEVSALVSVLPMNIQDWFSLWLTGSPYSPRDSQESSPTPQFTSINSSALSFLHGPTLTAIHYYWKNHSFDQTELSWQNNVSVFNMLSRLAITFLPRIKCPLISWLQSPSAMVLEPQKIVYQLFPLFHHLFAMKWWDQMPWS